MVSAAADPAPRALHDRGPLRAHAPRGLSLTAWAVAALFATPFAYLAWSSIDGGADVVDVVFSRRTLVPLRNTLVLAVAVSVSASALGTALAWLVTRSDLPFRRAWLLLAPVPLVFPSFVGAFALVSSTSVGGVFEGAFDALGIGAPPRLQGFGGAWLVLTLFTYPYVLLPVAARLGSLPPSLEESARLLGRSPRQVMVSVVMPQIRSAIGAGGLLVFLYTLSDFGAVQLLRHDTLTRVIYANRVLDRTLSLSLSLLLGVLALAVTAGERTIARRQPVLASVRTRRPMQVSLGRWRIPALLGVVAVLGTAIAAPVASLVAWAVRGDNAIGVSQGDLVEPAFNTAIAGIVTALVAVAAVLPVAYLVTRHRSSSGAATTALVTAGFALPGLVIALAVARGSLQISFLSGLYQTFPLLVLAYVVHFGAQAMRTSQVAVATVPARLDDAARILGAGRLRRLRTIDLPLMLPGLAAGAGLVLLSTMKELPVTLLLAPFGFDTLATRTWAAVEDGFLAEAGVTSLLLVTVSAVLTWVLVIRRAERVA